MPSDSGTEKQPKHEVFGQAIPGMKNLSWGRKPIKNSEKKKKTSQGIMFVTISCQRVTEAVTEEKTEWQVCFHAEEQGRPKKEMMQTTFCWEFAWGRQGVSWSIY